jgi:hypothetical protein
VNTKGVGHRGRAPVARPRARTASAGGAPQRGTRASGDDGRAGASDLATSRGSTLRCRDPGGGTRTTGSRRRKRPLLPHGVEGGNLPDRRAPTVAAREVHCSGAVSRWLPTQYTRAISTAGGGPGARQHGITLHRAGGLTTGGATRRRRQPGARHDPGRTPDLRCDTNRPLSTVHTTTVASRRAQDQTTATAMMRPGGIAARQVGIPAVPIP